MEEIAFSITFKKKTQQYQKTATHAIKLSVLP